MQYEKNCTAFNTFGSDLKEARNALGLSRRALAEMVGMDTRYLANIENSGFIPSLSLFHDLATACKLPVQKYFYPELDENESEQRNRVKLKLALCPDKYLSFVESALDNSIQMEKETENG